MSFTRISSHTAGMSGTERNNLQAPTDRQYFHYPGATVCLHSWVPRCCGNTFFLLLTLAWNWNWRGCCECLQPFLFSWHETDSLSLFKETFGKIIISLFPALCTAPGLLVCTSNMSQSYTSLTAVLLLSFNDIFDSFFNHSFLLWCSGERPKSIIRKCKLLKYKIQIMLQVFKSVSKGFLKCINSRLHMKSDKVQVDRTNSHSWYKLHVIFGQLLLSLIAEDL